MKPYYEDDLVTLYHARCEDVLPTLSLSGSVHLLTDPPYFKVKNDDWDNQWEKASQFLDWMGEWLDLARPSLTADASVWVFASPQLTSAVESVVSQRFRVVNSIRWTKTGGDNLRRVSLPSMRSFVSIWEGIILAECRESEPDALHKMSMAPVAHYLRQAREKKGHDRRFVARALADAGCFKNEDTGTAMLSDWELGDSIPVAAAYRVIQDLYAPHLERSFDDLVAMRDELTAEFERKRRPFVITARELSEDIWRFDSVSHYPGKHPCEKPIPLLTHMISASTRVGDAVLDPFAGSGSTLDAARQMGRRAVGIEMDEQWCEQAATRLSQQVFNLAGIA